MDHIGDGSPQGGVDWQTVRRILLRAMPDWQPVNSSDPKPGDDSNLRAYSLCQAILEAYPKRTCSHCRREHYWWEFYRCWDCKTYLCGYCIKEHFGPNHRPHPKLTEQYDAEIDKLREALANIERARPHHYQMCFEDHAAFAQRLKALARAALQPSI